MSAICKQSAGAGATVVMASGFDLDALLTVPEFAAWTKTPIRTVRKKLGATPGVIRSGRKHVRIHPRTYLEASLQGRRKF